MDSEAAMSKRYPLLNIDTIHGISKNSVLGLAWIPWRESTHPKDRFDTIGSLHEVYYSSVLVSFY